MVCGDSMGEKTLGGSLTVGRNITFGQAAKTANLPAILALLQVSEAFERWLFFPAYGAVFLFGLVTAWVQGWPILGFLQGANSNWLLVSLLLWLGLGLVVPVYLGPRRKQRAAVVEEARAQNKITPKLTAALNDKVVPMIRSIELIGFGVIIILMVTKPF